MADEFGFEEEKPHDDFGFQEEGTHAPAAEQKKGFFGQAWDNLTHFGDRSRAALDKPKAVPPPGQPPVNESTYKDFSPEQLNWLQRAEKGAADIGLVKPGHELFSPGAMRQKGLAAETAVNTGVMGYLPQIYGAVKSGSIANNDYIRERDAMVNELGQAKGGTAAVGQAVGMLPSLLAAGPKLLAQTATKRVGQAMAGGGLASFLSNPGDKVGEYNPTQFGERLDNAKVGALTAGALATATSLPEIAAQLKKSANLRAVKQAGAMLPDMRKLEEKGLLQGTRRDGQPTAGEVMHNEKIITPLARPEDIELRSQGLVDREMEKVNGVYQTLDDNFDKLASHPTTAAAMPSGVKMADAIEAKLIKPNQGVVAMEPYMEDLQKVADKFRELGTQTVPGTGARPGARGPGAGVSTPGTGLATAEQLAQNAGGNFGAETATPGQPWARMPQQPGTPPITKEIPMTFGEARKQIQGYDEILKKAWGKEGSVGQEFAKDVRGVLNGVLEDGVEKIGEATNFPLLAEFKKAKHLARTGIELKEISKDYQMREFKNRYGSPSDYGMGGIGAVIAHGHGGAAEQALIALAAGAGNHVVRKYGNAVVSTGAQKASEFLSNPALQASANQVGQKAIQGGVAAGQVQAANQPQTVAQQRDAVMAKVANTPYAQQLAGAKTDDDFALRYFTLHQQEPGFREAMGKGQPQH